MVIKETEANSDGWMAALLRLPIMRGLPPINLQKIIMGLELVDFKQGEVIIAQGSVGDYYYLIKNGQCLCSRKASPNAKEIKIRQLTAADTFGEDALISGAPRDLTISALTDVSVLRLDKQRFLSLIKEPSLVFVDCSQLQEAIKQGAVLLDARMPEEYKKRHIKGSINEPFFSLRMQLKTLNRDKPYIVICADGRISEAGAFLLLNNNIEAKVLKGGIASLSQELDAETGLIIDADNNSGQIVANRPENTQQTNGPTSSHPAGVIDNSVKAFFMQGFEQLVDDCCMQIDFEFGMQLGRKRETMNKDQYNKLREYLRSVRDDIKRDYIAKVKNNCDGGSQATANNQAEQVDLSVISLISEETAKENSAIDMIVRQCEHLLHDELAKLNKQFKVLPNKQAIANSQNPIFPSKLVHSFADVVKPLKLSSDNKIVLYKTFEANVFSQLGLIYRQLLNSAETSA